MTTNPQTDPIRKSALPTTRPPEWEFHTWFPHPDGGGDMVRGERQRGVVVRRCVTYGDWEPVRPDRWADEPEGAAPAAGRVVSAAPTQTDVERIAEIVTPFLANFSDDETARINAREVAAAVLPVLPPPVGRAAEFELRGDTEIRAAALREAAEVVRGMDTDPNTQAAADELRRLADAAQQQEPERPRCTCGFIAESWIKMDHAADCPARPQPEAQQQADTETPTDIQVWPLQRVLTEVQCGSQDWTWEEEWADLDRRHAETGYLAKLEQQIRENGITMPVLVGSDGRLWDGHHRLRIAVRLDIGYVPVEITPPAVVAEQPAAADNGEETGAESPEKT